MDRAERAEELLLKLHEVFEEAGITFWLLFGTCLGYYRDGGFISWDEDIDIGFFRKDFNEKLVPLLEEKIGGLRCFSTQENDIRIIKLGARGCPERFNPWIDIVPFYESENDYWFLKDPRKYNYTSKEREILMGVKYPKRFFDNLEQIEIYGKIFNIPSPVDEYLEFVYGEDWCIPMKRKEYMPDPANEMKNIIEVYNEPRSDIGKQEGDEVDGE